MLANRSNDQRQKIRQLLRPCAKIMFCFVSFLLEDSARTVALYLISVRLGYYIFTSTDKYKVETARLKRPRRDVFIIISLKSLSSSKCP